MNILEALYDSHLFKPWLRDPETWRAWTAFLAALFALPLTPEQREIYRQCTGRQEPHPQPHHEAHLICGRRAGKSFVLALIGVFLATFRDYRPYLQPGERATVMVIAADRRQARVIMRYVQGLLTDIPMLARMVESERAEGYDLNNSTTIEVATTSFRTTRGYTLAAALLDEIAFWRTDDGSKNPDHEIVNAIKPAMATIPGSVLLTASSPYAKRGVMWDAYRKFYGTDAPVLVWKAPTRVMNPTVPQSLIDAELERDEAYARAEYLAEFRDDISSFISREAILACIKPGKHERMPERRNRYIGYVDPSGGRADSMTIAIAYKDGDTPILAALREVKPPFNPEMVVTEFADLCKRYRVVKVYGDRYAGEWPVAAFRNHHIVYEASERTTSQVFIDFLPLVNAGACDLLDNDRMVNQLASLERRSTRGSRDVVGHPPGGHDDVAAAVAGAVTLAQKGMARDRSDYRPIRVEGVQNYDVHGFAYAGIGHNSGAYPRTSSR
jgi:hypothetical protein